MRHKAMRSVEAEAVRVVKPIRIGMQENDSHECPPRQKQNNFRKLSKQKQNNMIIMPVKEGENIEKALKKFKRKYERTGVLKELRRRQYFTKPSVAKREARQRAIYVEHTYRQEE